MNRRTLGGCLGMALAVLSGAAGCTRQTGFCETDADCASGMTCDANGTYLCIPKLEFKQETIGTSQNLYGVAVDINHVSGQALWIVGDSGEVFSLDPNTKRLQRNSALSGVPGQPAIGKSLRAVTVDSGTVTAVGLGGAYFVHKAGDAAWMQPLPAASTDFSQTDLFAIRSRAADELFAVGNQNFAKNGATPLIQSIPVVNGDVLYGLYTVAGTAVKPWAVGKKGVVYVHQGDWVPFSTTSQGKNADVRVPTSGTLYGIWGNADASVLWSVGSLATLVYAQGNKWRSCADEPGFCPATPDPTVTQDFYAVWGVSEAEFFIVGGQGLLLYFDGKRFRKLASVVASDLLGIHGSVDGKEVWAVGKSGTALHLSR